MFENEMGVGGESDVLGPVDVNEETEAVAYGWSRGTEDSSGGDVLRHGPRFSRADYSAIVDAAQISRAAWEAHIEQEHPGAWTWLQAQPAKRRTACFIGDRAVRGL